MIEGHVASSDTGEASTRSSFDQVSVTVDPGIDVVARSPGVLLVSRGAGTDDGGAALRAVLDLLELVPVEDIEAVGQRFVRQLLALIAEGSAPLDLAVLAATGPGLAVVLSGAALLTASGHPLQLAAADGSVTSREIDWPPVPLRLSLDGDPQRCDPAAAPQSTANIPFDLRGGVVPGGAVVLGAPVAGNREPQVPDASARPPERSTTAMARGYRCRDGHLNDPRALFCATCGIRMAESTSVLVKGLRPPLGLLVFDNGASFTLDADYLLGRQPEADERVRTGQLRPLVLFDTAGAISRRHAEIRLEEWDVLLLDCGSANGTFIAERGALGWSALVPGQPVKMTPGVQVRIGDRSFVFESLQGSL